MKIKDIVQLADTFLSTQLPSSLFTKTTSDSELVAALAAKPLSLLVACVNLTLAEIATEYLPLIKKESVTAVNNTVPYSAFSLDVLKVLRVTSCYGARVAFRYRPTHIEVDEDGELNVVYSYRPSCKGFLEEIERGNSALTARVAAYGAAAEYCLLSGRYDEAVTWDKRYKDSLAVLCKSRGGRIKARVFA